MITIRRQAAIEAQVPTLFQRLTNLSTADARLRSTTRIDFHEHPTSLFRFVGQHKYESRPRGVVNLFCEAAASQAADIQIFHCNQAVFINEPAREVVQEVVSPLADVTMKPPQRNHGLTATVRSFAPTGGTSLQATQLGLSGLEPARVFNSEI